MFKSSDTWWMQSENIASHSASNRQHCKTWLQCVFCSIGQHMISINYTSKTVASFSDEFQATVKWNWNILYFSPFFCWSSIPVAQLEWFSVFWNILSIKADILHFLWWQRDIMLYRRTSTWISLLGDAACRENILTHIYCHVHQ